MSLVEATSPATHVEGSLATIRTRLEPILGRGRDSGQNDGLDKNAVWAPFPHDRRCGCRLCTECRHNAPCAQCDGGCVICRGLVPHAPSSLAGVRDWWPEGRARNAGWNDFSRL